MSEYPIMEYFTYKDLPPKLQQISKPFCDLAQFMADELPKWPETAAGLRKVLEAKDCAVRSALGLK